MHFAFVTINPFLERREEMKDLSFTIITEEYKLCEVRSVRPSTEWKYREFAIYKKRKTGYETKWDNLYKIEAYFIEVRPEWDKYSRWQLHVEPFSSIELTKEDNMAKELAKSLVKMELPRNMEA